MTERYVVSAERLAEIRAMVSVDDIDVLPVASADDLASAVYDLLCERDDAQAGDVELMDGAGNLVARIARYARHDWGIRRGACT